VWDAGEGGYQGILATAVVYTGGYFSVIETAFPVRTWKVVKVVPETCRKIAPIAVARLKPSCSKFLSKAA